MTEKQEWPSPFKCRKCNIMFATIEEAFKHLADTSYIESHPDPNHIGRKGTFFHAIVDKYGDDLICGQYFGKWT